MKVNEDQVLSKKTRSTIKVVHTRQGLASGPKPIFSKNLKPGFTDRA